MDGSAARFQHKQSDLGGYLDQLLDTVVYALLPIALVASNPSPAGYASLALLLAAYYLNTVSWLYLAALLEKRRRGTSVHLERPREMTSITMPSGLIEGAETVVFYSLFLLWPDRTALLFGVFATLVLITVGQRVTWAMHGLRE